MKKILSKFKKINIKLSRRAKSMLIFFGIFTFVITAATYAWFISLRQVNITSFNLKIDTNLNLLLSLDGKNWDNVVFIDEFNYNDPNNVFAGNTNAWSRDGLVPISSNGNVDVASSRMELYQKIGLGITSGGYRLLANRVNNGGEEERPGYVAFDLFIKNFSKKTYIEEIDYLTEEAIYLGESSFVKVTDPLFANRGIENSVRIAFAQIGTSVWNQYSGDAKYVGYMFGGTSGPNGASSTSRNGTGSLVATYNETNTTMKTALDNWYKTNIYDKGYGNQVVDNLFCNDRQLQSEVAGDATGPGYGSTQTLYAARHRLQTNKALTLKCGLQNDRFTVSDLTLGNGTLTYPVGLLTADEASMAGFS